MATSESVTICRRSLPGMTATVDRLVTGKTGSWTTVPGALSSWPNKNRPPAAAPAAAPKKNRRVSSLCIQSALNLYYNVL